MNIPVENRGDYSPNASRHLTVPESGAGQRLDQILPALLPEHSRGRLQSWIREGRVTVDGRVEAEGKRRLRGGEALLVMPAPDEREAAGAAEDIPLSVIFEDEVLLVIDKPAGMAVHGGSGISRGVIEQLRLQHPEFKFLELVHRLDRETSGILLLAKKRSALLAMHEAIRNGATDKRYLTLVRGCWKNRRQSVKAPLQKTTTADGERRVFVCPDGQPSHTVFNLVQAWPEFSLLEAELKTGRTHQIRVHLQSLDFPIAGDDKYGDFALNKALQKRGLKRMFLHAYRLALPHPLTGQPLQLEAPLPPELQKFVDSLDESH